MLGTVGTINWNRPGEVIIAGRHGDRRRHGEQAGQHIASSRRHSEDAGQRPTQPGSESPAAEYAVKRHRRYTAGNVALTLLMLGAATLRRVER